MRKYISFIFIIVITIGFLYTKTRSKQSKSEQAQTTLEQRMKKNEQLTKPIKRSPKPIQRKPIIVKPPHYEVVHFKLKDKLKGFSNRQIEEHLELYHGYVRKRNEIAQRLSTIHDSTSINCSIAPFRALKLQETFNMNGDILHRLYFENMGTDNKKIGPQFEQLIKENFGSIENFKRDLFDTGKAARGWTITAYSIDDNRIHNYLLEAHNQSVPVLTLPLLVIDVYEHAYMIDFGIKRVHYLDAFWDNIKWDVVEQRIDKWVNKFHPSTRSARSG